MARLCIYITYNREHRIYEYIGQVLKSLKENCSKVVLICNYERIETGSEYVVPYADEIFYRENKGYDSGAYRDIICNILGWDEIRGYDELVLANDSFFGFFYPLQDTFELMDKSKCDFWGMTGQTAGEFSNPSYKFDSHVHSYFLVFRRNVIIHKAFKEFWERLEYPSNFREAVVNFEIGINKQLKAFEFKGISYIDIYNIRLEANENPYYTIPFELVKDYRVPIMKKKSVLVRNIGFMNMMDTLTYLKKGSPYPVKWIEDFLENQFYVPQMDSIPCNSLERFYKRYSDIYIYGAGVCGKNLAVYFAYKGWNYKGFIVTSPTGADVHAVSMQEADINSGTGIIVSVIDRRVADEITKNIGERCREEQIFYISDCDAIRPPD